MTTTGTARLCQASPAGFPTMTYPDWFAAVMMADAPTRSRVMDPPTRCQVVPSAEVSTT